MGFRSRRVSFARHHVTGGPDAPTAEMLEALAAGELRTSGVGTPAEIEAGWVAGRHVYDADFSEEVVGYGDVLLFGLRIDTNRVPAEIRNAFRVMEEDVAERCREELASGRHRKSSLLPVMWDVRRRLVLAPTFSDAKRSTLDDLFRATFDAGLEPLSSGGLAQARLGAKGALRDYEDLAPTAFTSAPPGAYDEERGGSPEIPVVPWSMAGPQPKDFLGNEFLMWLWGLTVRGDTLIETSRGQVGVVIERLLETECAWSVTGTQVLRSDTPTRWPESTKAFTNGKWPRKAGLVLAAEGLQWELTFQADRFLVTSAKLPDTDEAPASERELIEHRVVALSKLDETLVALFDVFLEQRTSRAWASVRRQVADTIARKPASNGVASAEVEIVTRSVAPVA